ncbi:MAG: hypothetical protein QXG39_01395 [Candidatus Aenigmatarchaeota archaeon]
MGKSNFWKGLGSLVSMVGGAGAGYLVAQCGSIVYLACREITSFLTGNPITDIPQILKDYSIYTSAAALIGEVGGYILHKKIWKLLGGE